MSREAVVEGQEVENLEIDRSSSGGGWGQPAGPPEPGGDGRRLRMLVAAVGVPALLGLTALIWIGSQGGWYEAQRLTRIPTEAKPEPGGEEAREAAARRIRRRLEALAPRGVYVVVDSYANRLRILRDGEVLREAICSTGSGTVLRDPEKGRLWIFETPLGERRVQRKVRDPVWTKPDWAFIEEGFQPPKMPSERVDEVSLGDYALDLGDGYLIHGTLFQTLLGRRITHGCIRLGDEDLAYVYKTVPLGARVYLY